MRKNLKFLLSTSLLMLLVVFLKPIPQLWNYHDFADQRSAFGIPNAWNVLSNAAIALPGLIGLYFLLMPNRHYRDRLLWIGVMIGLVLTGAGSVYYHLAPDDARLVFDRLSMTFVFMTLAAALIGGRWSFTLWPVLVAIGFYSVWFWYANGDLRFYLSVQAFALLMTAFVALEDRDRDLAAVIICYGLALLFDRFDHQVYKWLGGVISGHTLKHVAVGAAGAALVTMIYKRKVYE